MAAFSQPITSRQAWQKKNKKYEEVQKKQTANGNGNHMECAACGRQCKADLEKLYTKPDQISNFQLKDRIHTQGKNIA